MTETVFAVIDNHTHRKKTNYNIMYKTKDFRKFMNFIYEKGLVN